MAKPARFGASEPLHVYQDEMYENAALMISHATMPPATKPPRRPLQNANANVNIVLNPPNLPGAKPSPFKASVPASGSPPMPMTSGQANRLNMVSMMPPSSASRPTDNLEKKQPMMSNFKTVAKKAGTDSHHSLYAAPPHFSATMENYGGNSHGKRVLLEAAPIKELRPAKKPKLEDSLPAPDSFPPIVDDGAKPGHSYAQLIGMAILRSPQRRLTLAQIYKWISDTFSFYNPNDAGWQNSIRHNLSLNKNFLKQERPKDDPGKGNYWAIEHGAEHLFMKEKPARKSTVTAENVPIMSTCLELAQPQQHQHQLQPQLPLMSESMMHHPQYPMSQAPLPSLPVSSQALPTSLPAEISSDATIPQSELAAFDEMVDKALGPEAHTDGDLYSPLPAAMHSSPPIPKHIDPHHNDTPPPMQRCRGSSISKSRSHKRKFASADDSGYISSLESSVMRPNPHSKLLTSEADRSRIKRGRAEEEIARLRASSYDSPTKSRSFGYAPASSSPLRRTNEAGQMLPPLTPAMKLKAPPKPPPSVSPNTNLRLHRESVQSMIESPYRRADSIMPKENAMFSLTPGFALDDIFDGLPRCHNDGLDFDIFQDSPLMPVFAVSPAVPLNGSPIKRSVKKPRHDRAQSASTLHDTTAKTPSINVMSAAGLLKASGQNAGLVLDTPSKVFDGLPSSPSKVFLQSPSKMPLMNDENMAPWISMDELCGGDFLEDNDFTGIDIVAGFERIGSSTTQMTRPGRPSQKPPMGRSYTSTF